jgi:hypothetical protein
VAQAVEYLDCKCEALGSDFIPTKNKKWKFFSDIIVDLILECYCGFSPRQNLGLYWPGQILYT